jgi:hypothetical protein
MRLVAIEPICRNSKLKASSLISSSPLSAADDPSVQWPGLRDFHGWAVRSPAKQSASCRLRCAGLTCCEPLYSLDDGSMISGQLWRNAAPVARPSIFMTSTPVDTVIPTCPTIPVSRGLNEATKLTKLIGTSPTNTSTVDVQVNANQPASST